MERSEKALNLALAYVIFALIFATISFIMAVQWINNFMIHGIINQNFGEGVFFAVLSFILFYLSITFKMIHSEWYAN
jgi:hypothetical protein